MSWVNIDKDKCNGCGICALRCARCFSNKDGEIEANADELCCNLCGHCVSLCPEGAITHQRMNMDNFIPIGEKINFTADDFINFVRQRRSHRSFKEKDVPREELEKLADMCRYAPTGSNFQTVEIMIVTNQEKVKKLSDLTIDFFMDQINQVEKEVNRLASEGKEIPKELNAMHEFAGRYSLLAKARDMGLDPILYKAPAVMIFHSPTTSTTPKDDCVIAAQTVVLAAMTMGIETCYIGLLNFSANSYQPVIKELNLPVGNKVFSVLVLGYPRMKYYTTVDRKPIKVQWVV